MTVVWIRTIQAGVAAGLTWCLIMMGMDLPGLYKWAALLFVAVSVGWVLPYLAAALERAKRQEA